MKRFFKVRFFYQTNLQRDIGCMFYTRTVSEHQRVTIRVSKPQLDVDAVKYVPDYILAQVRDLGKRAIKSYVQDSRYVFLETETRELTAQVIEV